MFLLQKKGLILVFVVLVVVSMDVQAAVDSCLYDCKVERINCVRSKLLKKLHNAFYKVYGEML